MSDDPTPPPADQARRLLDRARRGGGQQPRPRRPRRVPPDEQAWSGPAAGDARDPAPVGAAVSDLVQQRKWDATVRSAGLLARWDDIVGADIAEHCRPERLEGGELVCVAESTAWATQLRMLSGQVLTRIAAELGPDVVRRLRVHGPSAPDWRHGPLRVTGRGPRDTYG